MIRIVDVDDEIFFLNVDHVSCIRITVGDSDLHRVRVYESGTPSDVINIVIKDDEMHRLDDALRQRRS